MAGIGKADGSVRRRTLRVILSHVVAVGRQMRRRRKAQPRRDSLLQRLFPPTSTNQTAAVAVPAQEAAGPDPVKIAALAIDGVARASMRACFSGSEIAVAAPDQATASVLRSALAVTGQTRATDRLIRIVVN